MTEIVVAQSNTASPLAWTPEQMNLIKNQICKGATDDELRLFLYQCKRSGLDPLSRQIYAVSRNVYDSTLRTSVPKMQIQTSIDGFRLIAERTGKYAGQLGPFWCGSEGKWVDVWLAKEYPSAAKIGVLRSDFKEPLWGVAHWKEYAQVYNGKVSTMWEKMSALMIAKCAEGLALRKAFPQELSGLYTADEMSQAEEPKPPATPPVAPTPKVERAPTKRAIDAMGPPPAMEKSLGKTDDLPF